MAQVKKLEQVDNLIKLLEANKNFALINFDRTTHQKLEKLRHSLKKVNSSFKVVKNTLLEKAINKLSVKEKLMLDLHKSAFPTRESTALLALNDEWEKSLSEFYKFAKEEKTLSFKIGILDNQIYTSEDLKKIAELPPKEQLIANLIGSLKAPMNNLVYNMKFNINKLVYILNEKSRKGGDTNG